MEQSLNNYVNISDEALQKYNQSLNSSMKSILTYARQNYIPVLLEDTAKLLFNLVYNLKPASILEIGTAIGYSGTLMLSASSKSKLTTIENLESNYNLALQHFKTENLSDRVELIFNDAYNALVNLEQQNRKFDFIFLDGPKGQYIKYLPIIKNLLTKNGVLIADNVHFKGMVFLEGVIPHKKRTIVVNLRKFIAQIKSDSDFETYELKVGDGIILSKKLKD